MGGRREGDWMGGKDGGTGVDEREGRVEDKKEWMREEEERMGERGVGEREECGWQGVVGGCFVWKRREALAMERSTVEPC